TACSHAGIVNVLLLKSSPLAFQNRPSRGCRPRAPLRRYPPPSCAACPGRAPPCCEPQRLAAAGRWGRRQRRQRGVAAGGGVRPEWRREKWLWISYTSAEQHRRGGRELLQFPDITGKAATNARRQGKACL